MGRSRRRNKTSSDLDISEVCENCRLVQKGHEHYSRGVRRQRQARHKTEHILKFLTTSEYSGESETDSAIDTASVTSFSDNGSIISSSESGAELGLEDSMLMVTPKRHSRRSAVAEVSIIALEEEEAQADLLALTDFVTGVPFQKFTSRDSCEECIESYRKVLHQYQHSQMAMCGVDDSFFVDITGLDLELHVEEFTNWSIGSTTVQTKEHGYYVSPEGATYYTDAPLDLTLDTRLLALPRLLMVPPSERAMCKTSLHIY